MSNFTKNGSLELRYAEMRLSMYFYSSITFMPLGIVLNITTTFIFLRKRFAKLSMGFFYSYMAFCNALTLLVTVLQILPESLGFNPVNNFEVWCRLWTFLRKVTIGVANWLQVFVTLERMINVLYPTRWTFIAKRRFQMQQALVALAIIVALSFTEFLRTRRWNESSGSLVCGQYIGGITVYNKLMSINVNMFIPFIVMIVANVVLIRKLAITSHHKNITMTTQRTRRVNSIAVSVITMNGIFLVMQIPFAVTSIIQIVLVFVPNIFGNKNNLLLFSFIDETVRMTFLTGYYSITFWINLAFNKLLRHELQATFCCLHQLQQQ